MMMLSISSLKRFNVHSVANLSKKSFGTSIQVILEKDLADRGTKGEVVKVKRGYARNFLIPRGLAGNSITLTTWIFNNEFIILIYLFIIIIILFSLWNQ